MPDSGFSTPGHAEHQARLAGAVRAEQGGHLARRVSRGRPRARPAGPLRATVKLSSVSVAHADLLRALDVLGAEVGLHDRLVAQHLGGRAGGDQLAEVEHGGDRRSTRRPGSCRGRRGSRARPCARGCRWITRPRCSVSSSGRPAPGSSSSTSLGLPTTARATSTRRRSRAPSVPDLRVGVHVEPDELDRAEHVLAPRRAVALLAVLVRERDVAGDRQLLDRLLGLERAPQPPARAPVVRHREQVLAVGAGPTPRPGPRSRSAR